MKLQYLFATISLLLVWTVPAWAEPYSPVCGGAIERISKARNALLPLRRNLELARAGEVGAYGELPRSTSRIENGNAVLPGRPRCGGAGGMRGTVQPTPAI